jgi:hypothetical protein
MVLKVCGFEDMFFVRQEMHFSLANMVGRTARTLPLAAVSGGRAHRGWQARVTSKARSKTVVGKQA